MPGLIELKISEITLDSVTIDYVCSGFSDGPAKLVAYRNDLKTLDAYAINTTDITIFSGSATGSITIDSLETNVTYSVLVKVKGIFAEIKVKAVKQKLDSPILSVSNKKGGADDQSGSADFTITWRPLDETDDDYVPYQATLLYKLQYQSINPVVFNIIKDDIIINEITGLASYTHTVSDLPTDEIIESCCLITNAFADSELSNTLDFIIPSNLDIVQNVNILQDIAAKKLIVKFTRPLNALDQHNGGDYRFKTAKYIISLEYTDSLGNTSSFPDNTLQGSDSEVLDTVTDQTNLSEELTGTLDLIKFFELTGSFIHKDIKIKIISKSTQYSQYEHHVKTDATIQGPFADILIAPTTDVILNYDDLNIKAYVPLIFLNTLDQNKFRIVPQGILKVEIIAKYEGSEDDLLADTVNLNLSELFANFENSKAFTSLSFGKTVSFYLRASVKDGTTTYTNPDKLLSTIVISLKPRITSVKTGLNGTFPAADPTGVNGSFDWALYGQTIAVSVSNIAVFVKGTPIDKIYDNFNDNSITTFNYTKLPNNDDFVFGTNYIFGVKVTYTDNSTDKVSADPLTYGSKSNQFKSSSLLQPVVNINNGNAVFTLLTKYSEVISGFAAVGQIYYIDTSIRDTDYQVIATLTNGTDVLYNDKTQKTYTYIIDNTKDNALKLVYSIVYPFNGGTVVRTFTSSAITISPVVVTSVIPSLTYPDGETVSTAQPNGIKLDWSIDKFGNTINNFTIRSPGLANWSKVITDVSLRSYVVTSDDNINLVFGNYYTFTVEASYSTDSVSNVFTTEQIIYGSKLNTFKNTEGLYPQVTVDENGHVVFTLLTRFVDVIDTFVSSEQLYYIASTDRTKSNQVTATIIRNGDDTQLYSDKTGTYTYSDYDSTKDNSLRIIYSYTYGSVSIRFYSGAITINKPVVTSTTLSLEYPDGGQEETSDPIGINVTSTVVTFGTPVKSLNAYLLSWLVEFDTFANGAYTTTILDGENYISLVLGDEYSVKVSANYGDNSETDTFESDSIQYGYDVPTFNTENTLTVTPKNNHLVWEFLTSELVNYPENPQWPLTDSFLSVKFWFNDRNNVNTLTDAPIFDGPVPIGPFDISDYIHVPLVNGEVYYWKWQFSLSTVDTNLITKSYSSIVLSGSGSPRHKIIVDRPTKTFTHPTETSTKWSVIINTNGLVLQSYNYLGVTPEINGVIELEQSLVNGTNFDDIASANSGRNVTLTFNSDTYFDAVILFISANLSDNIGSTVDSQLILFGEDLITIAESTL